MPNYIKSNCLGGGYQFRTQQTCNEAKDSSKPVKIQKTSQT